MLVADIAAAFASSPVRRTAELTVARRAMACEFSITFPGGIRRGVDAGCLALDEVERIETKLSVFLPDSDISWINRSAAGAAVPVDPEIYALLRFARVLSFATGGAFDPAAGALVRAWGFRGGLRKVPGAPALAEARARSGIRQVIFDDTARTVRFQRAGVEFNLGAIGKGYAIDRALARLRRQYGIQSALMQGGQSSLKGMGAPPGERRGWAVDLGDPRRLRPAVARVWLKDSALGTSGTANQSFVEAGRRYGHLLDPRSGRPADALLSASAIAPTAALADALSTAFFVLGEEGTRQFCRRHASIGAVLLVADKRKEAAARVVVLGAAETEVLV